VWGQGGEMNQALYAHMNNKRKMKKEKKRERFTPTHSVKILKDKYILKTKK
jgi:hypothetical protein